MRLWLASLLVLLLCGCRRDNSAVPSPTPEQAYVRIGAAVRAHDYRRVFALLDHESRWSLMSAHRLQREAGELVRKHYPSQLQARELERWRLALAANAPEQFFEAYAREHCRAELQALGQPSGPGTAHPSSGARVELGSQGQRVPFCREDAGWAYCGLRERFEQLKVKAARDLELVKENAENYR